MIKVILNELMNRNIVRSKRSLSVLLGRAPNYVCESRGFFTAADLVEIRLHLLRIGGHEDLRSKLEEMILSSWRDM
jgi:hypothetical protein